MRVDLITGFLGAGKTTFLKKYAAYLEEKGERFRIIENEFCAFGVDSMLLKDTHDDIQDLSGYCMCCTGKDMFIQMLVDAGEQGYDRVLVEPSGIYDVDEFFSVMEDPEVLRLCETGSVVTILDVSEEAGLSSQSDYLMLTQLLAAGCILVSKTQLHSEDALRHTLSEIGARLSPYMMDGHSPMIVSKSWDELTSDDYRAIEKSGCFRVPHERIVMDHAGLYGTYMAKVRCADEADLLRKISRVFSDPACGQVLRIKGYAVSESGEWFAVNCTPDQPEVRPAKIRRGLLIVIGQGLNEDRLSETL